MTHYLLAAPQGCTDNHSSKLTCNVQSKKLVQQLHIIPAPFQYALRLFVAVQDTVPHTGGSQVVMQKRGTFTGLEYLKSSHMVRTP